MDKHRSEMAGALSDAFAGQLKWYGEALAAADAVVAALESRRDATGELRHMQAALDEVAAIDERVRGVKAAWDSLRLRADGTLRERAEQVRRLLPQLIERVAQAESLAKQARDRLMPEVSHEALGRRMQSAYGGD